MVFSALHRVFDRSIPSHHLSSSLRLIVFSCLLTQKFPIMGYRHGNSTLVSNLSFANDVIIFVNCHKHSIRRLLDCLEHYEGISSKLVNREKSGLLLLRKASIGQIKILEHLTGFRHPQQLFLHLGFSI